MDNGDKPDSIIAAAVDACCQSSAGVLLRKGILQVCKTVLLRGRQNLFALFAAKEARRGRAAQRRWLPDPRLPRAGRVAERAGAVQGSVRVNVVGMLPEQGGALPSPPAATKGSGARARGRGRTGDTEMLCN